MSQYLLTPYAIPDPTVTTHAQVVRPLSPVRAAIQVSEFDGKLETRNHNSTDLLCCGLPIPIVMTTSRTSGPRSRAVHILKLIITFLFDRFPRQLYLSALLYLPTLYYTRVTRILEDAEQMIPAVRKLYSSDSPQQETASFIASFKVSWELFVDSIMREWNTLNIVSVLLLSVILTMLQIQGAGDDPVTRTGALLALVCALMSLLFGCMYVVRFGSMKRTHQALTWAEEAQKINKSIWWNVWVLLAMPAVWLSWSIIMFVFCILSFVWRTGSSTSPPSTGTFAALSPRKALGIRVAITSVLFLGLTYFVLIVKTLRRFGTKMDRKWTKRVERWIAADTPAVETFSLGMNSPAIGPPILGRPPPSSVPVADAPVDTPALVKIGQSLDNPHIIPPRTSVQPPPLIPFTYQPVPQTLRPEIMSPTTDFPIRPHTAPVRFDPQLVRQTTIQAWQEPRSPSSDSPSEGGEPPRVVPTSADQIMGDAGSKFPSGQVVDQVVISFHLLKPSLFDNASVLQPHWYNESERLSSTPQLGGEDIEPVATGRPRPPGPDWSQYRMNEQVVPPPGDFGPARPSSADPAIVPKPPSHTEVPVPPFDTIIRILRDHRLAQLATVDQQREMMRYLRGLNEWLGCDVEDRQAGLRGISFQVDQLRDDLNGLSMNVQALVVSPGPMVGLPTLSGFGPSGMGIPHPELPPNNTSPDNGIPFIA